MTLVMYIPYNGGSILMADRQSTEREATGWNKQEVKKLCLKNGNGPAIGCAGHTELIQSLFGRIKEKTDINNENIIDELKKLMPDLAEQWKNTYKEYNNLVAPLENLELFVLMHNGTEIVVYHLHGLLSSQLESVRCHGIGEGLRVSGSLLDWDTRGLPEQGAILWGETILRQVALHNFTVGAPEYHGYDVVIVSNQGKFRESSGHPSIPKTVDAVSMLKKLGKIEIVEDKA